MSELYHHGVKGMKWGVRKSEDRASKGRRHLSLDEKGRVILTTSTEKASKQAKTAFAVRLSITAASAAGFMYLSKHPEIMNKTLKKIRKVDRMAEIEKLILDDGPEIVRKVDVARTNIPRTSTGPTRFEPSTFKPSTFQYDTFEPG